MPESWNADRARCQAAGIPDEVRYRPKWRITLDYLARLSGNSRRFDWLVFDEGYRAAVPFLRILNLVGQRFVPEVPVNLWSSSFPTAALGAAEAIEPFEPAHGGKDKNHKLAEIEQKYQTYMNRGREPKDKLADQIHRLEIQDYLISLAAFVTLLFVAIRRP